MYTIYHGSDNPKIKLISTKSGFGYHTGAGPVEFIGPSFTVDKNIALSYGRYLYRTSFQPQNPKTFRSMNSLKKDIEKSFGYLKPGDNVGNLGAYYKDIAENYRIKLQLEGYDSILFKEGSKFNTSVHKARTIIIISEDLPKIRLTARPR